MKKFLPFSRRQPSLDRHAVNRAGWTGSDRFGGKSMRRISASSLNTKSIQVVRGAYNIDLNKVDSSFTKLHRACLMNDDIQVKKHIHKVDNNSHDTSNRYPIHLATVNGNFAIVKLLIENKADPNVQDNEGNTPLIKSIECGHEHLVKYLLNNGANPNLSDLDNNTALHWAIMTESIIAIDALLSSKKCNLSLRNNKDETCLHLAVRSPLINTLTFESLVRNGSDVNAKDQLGLTAIDIAQACNNKIAINAFNRCLGSNYNQEQPTSNNSSNQGDISENNQQQQQSQQQASSALQDKICEGYKLKYITKSRENLEYETRLIQLTAQIERLKLDMYETKEKNEKLESDYAKLSAENAKLKMENSKLLEQINKDRQRREFESVAAERDSNRIDPSASGCNRADISLESKVDSVDCRGHEEFLVAKAFLQERINKLKYGLTTMQL